MYSIYINNYNFQNFSLVKSYNIKWINYLFFYNYKYFYCYYTVLTFIKNGKKLYIERQISYSIQIIYYNLKWCLKLVPNIKLTVEHIIRSYVYWLNSLYRLVLNKLRRKAGTKSLVYKIKVNVYIFKNRLRGGVFFLKNYVNNSLFRFFLSFLVFFHFVIFFNFKFTLFFFKKLDNYQSFFLHNQKKKVFFLTQVKDLNRRAEMLM